MLAVCCPRTVFISKISSPASDVPLRRTSDFGDLVNRCADKLVFKSASHCGELVAHFDLLHKRDQLRV